MKKDIEQLMLQNQIEAILVVGPGDHNPYMVYMTGGAHLTSADLVIRKGETPVLFHASMERDEAAKTGLRTVGYNQYPFSNYLKAVNGDRIKAIAIRYQKMLSDLGIESGKVLLYGKIESGFGYAVFSALQSRMPDITLVGHHQPDILLTAMATKDEEEINRIRQMGKVTTGVVAKTAEFLKSQFVSEGVLVGKDDKPITIGQVKKKIDLWLAEGGAENPEGTIFAIGRDAGVPHSSGKADDFLRLGQTIVFDIFPCEVGGGYFYDFTRTWCLGYASDEAQKLYEDVLSVYQQLGSELLINIPFKQYQKRTCELFEAQRHLTVRIKPDTEEGYVHALGHGVGLHIHEQPFSGQTSSENEILAPGSIFTMEPGLYYPERGMGVRLEDTYAACEDGSFEVLAEYPMDLVLPIKNQ